LVLKQPPAGYRGQVGIGDFFLEGDVAATGIRNLREVWREESYLDAVKSGETGSVFGGVL